MEIISDERFRKSIENNLVKIPPAVRRDFFDIIRNNFPVENIYILGGFVRDSISAVLYNYDFPINDLDLLIDDPEFNPFAEKFQKENLSRFGGFKFKYSGFSMDVFGMDNIFFLKDNLALEKNIENVLKGCDLTTSAFGYNLSSKEIYSVDAMKDIYRKEVNVNDCSYLKAAPTISRLILHADKMNFDIGKSGINYIKKNYSPKLDKEIMDFLKYKEVEHTFPLIKQHINEIILKLPQQGNLL